MDAVDQIEYDPRTKELIVTERLGPDEMGASAVVGRDVPAWLGLWVVVKWKQDADTIREGHRAKHDV